MKQSLTIQQLLEDELYESEELQDLLYTQWVLKLEIKQKEEARLQQELWKLFFVGDVCFLHDRTWCSECSVYGRGECPSTREERYGSLNDF